MKIVIAYDGSECSDAALDDLQAAGLPADVEAVVISVAEAWLPPPPEGVSLHDYVQDLQSSPQPFTAWQENAREISEAETLVQEAQGRLRSNFPGWTISTEATYGSPAWEILAKAEAAQADLVVVGSQGRSAVGRLFLGSISQKVLTEASCSVRVARGRVEVDPSPARIVVGFDASAGADAAVKAVTDRSWPVGTKVRLVAVTDIRYAGQVGLMPAMGFSDNGDWLRELAAGATDALRSAGLETEFVSEIGNPKSVITEIAEAWHADSIFVGANRRGGSIERFLLGSVSAAIAARAHCSVEVVRTQQK